MDEEARSILIKRRLNGKEIILSYPNENGEYVKINIDDANVQLFDFLSNVREGYDDISSDRIISMGAMSGISYLAKIAWLKENRIVEEVRRRDYLRFWKLMEGAESKFNSLQLKEKKK